MKAEIAKVPSSIESVSVSVEVSFLVSVCRDCYFSLGYGRIRWQLNARILYFRINSFLNVLIWFPAGRPLFFAEIRAVLETVRFPTQVISLLAIAFLRLALECRCKGRL